jgi:hypothetical protein
MKTIAILSVTFLLGLGGMPTAFAKTGKLNKSELKAERLARRESRQSEVSYQSQNQFCIDFGTIPGVEWNRSKDFDEATFTKNGVVLTAYYDNYGNLAGTTQNKAVSDLPAGSLQKIRKEYGDYAIGQVMIYHDNELSDTEMVLNGLPLGNMDSYFVKLTRGTQVILLKVSMDGHVSFSEQIS